MTPLTGNILLVDDSAIIRKLLNQMLSAEGHMVHEAKDGTGALTYLYNQPFDLIILDIHMPVLNGVQLLKKIQQNERFQHIPIIIISGNEDMEMIIECIKLGAVDYLTKPVNGQLLHARVQASLYKKQLYDRQIGYRLELETQYQQIQQTVEAKQEFWAGTVHQMRNLLTTPTAGFQVLGQLEQDPEQSREVLERIKGSVSQLTGLVNELNHLSKLEIDRLALEFEPVDLSLVGQHVRHMVRTKTEPEKHRFTLDLPDLLPPVYADKFRLAQILSTLVYGLISLSTAESQVIISAELDELSPMQMHIRVTCRYTESANHFGLRKLDAPLKNGFPDIHVTRMLVEKHNGRLWIEPHSPFAETAVHLNIPLYIEEIAWLTT